MEIYKKIRPLLVLEGFEVSNFRGYCGAQTIPVLQETAKFIKMSSAALRESHPHDIHITKEAPNYSVENA